MKSRVVKYLEKLSRFICPPSHSGLPSISHPFLDHSNSTKALSLTFFYSVHIYFGDEAADEHKAEKFGRSHKLMSLLKLDHEHIVLVLYFYTKYEN